MNRRSQALASTLALLALVAGAGRAEAATNGDKCAAAKMKAAAKYASCRLAADAKAKSTGDPVDYTKCNDGQSGSWTKIEDKYGVDCLTSGDQASVQGDLTDATQCVSSLLAGQEGSCTFTQNPPCAAGGLIVDGTCYVMGAGGDSCNAACGLAGMAYDDKTVTEVGNPGDISKCLNVVSKFGYPRGGSFGITGPPDTGCALSGGTFVYLTGSSTPTGSYPGFNRICACH